MIVYVFVSVHQGSPGNAIDLFAIWRKGLRRAQPVLTALATVGNQDNPSVLAIIVRLVSRLYLTANSSYFQFICTFQELHKHRLVW